MKKILLLILIFNIFSFAENITIKTFDFCTIEDIEDKKENFKESIQINTKNNVFFKQKYKKVINEKEFENLLKYVAFSFGHGQKDFFVFVDPECKYCRAFAKSVVNKLNSGTYHIILYPLAKHKNANKMIAFILEGSNDEKRFERFKAVLVEDKFDSKKFIDYRDSKKHKEYIQNVLKLGLESQIKSTPSFYKIDEKRLAKIKWSSFNDCVQEDF